jgi:hypothetical protein
LLAEPARVIKKNFECRAGYSPSDASGKTTLCGFGGVRHPELQDPTQLPRFSPAFAVDLVMLVLRAAFNVFTAVKDEEDFLVA